MTNNKFEVMILFDDGLSHRRYTPPTLVDAMLLAAKFVDEDERASSVTVTSPNGNQASWKREKGWWH